MRAAALALACASLLVCDAPARAEAPPKGTLGFVVTTWNTATYQSRFWDECPQGPSIGTDELWWQGLPKQDRSRLTRNGLVDATGRENLTFHRGPHGEDVCWKPTDFKDPPVHEAQGDLSYGMNLDGTADGRATAATCAHEKFPQSPDGDKDVDNQLYRILGCYVGWRGAEVVEEYGNQERRSSGRGLILIEVTGVDDTRNDADVEVSFYRAIDQMPRDPAGNILPYGSYRIDTKPDNTPRYGAHAHGKIVNGVLTTDAADVSLPYYANEGFAEMPFRGMKLRLVIAPDGKTAQGLVAGYYDIEKWYHRITNVEYLQVLGDYDCAAMYEAVHRLADGYPDKNGQCTAISSAFAVNASTAFVIHPKDADRKVAETTLMRASAE